MLATVFKLIHWGEPEAFYIEGSELAGEILVKSLIWYIIIAFFHISVNIPADYISLAETRWILRRMTKSRSRYDAMGLMLLDGFLSIAIFAIPLITVQLLLYFVFGYRYDFSVEDEVVTFVQASKLDDMSGIFGYTNYSTSIWIWITFLTALCVKFLYGLDAFKQSISNRLDVINEPMVSLGLVAAIFITTIYWPVILLCSVAFS